MDLRLFNGLILAGLTCFVPTVAQAQMFTPVPAANCVITRPRAVVSTQYHTQQVTTYRDVTETAYCQKQVVENIPVTSCKDVTVDEGGYQMVWVPKPVTKQVAQTVMQQQVKTVSVPVQTTRRVPQISTQVVPVQSVRYVEETVPVQMTAFASSCPTCGSGMAMSSPIFSPQVSYAPSSNLLMPSPMPANSSATIPTMPAITIPSNQTAQTPSNMKLETVPSRFAPEQYETVPARSVPAPRDEAAPRKTSMFKAVPSAATVWQSQSMMR